MFVRKMDKERQSGQKERREKSESIIRLWVFWQLKNNLKTLSKIKLYKRQIQSILFKSWFVPFK
jgi:hypothetical protein